MIRVFLGLLIVATAAFAQKPLLLKPCMMCDILDEDSTAKVLSYFAEFNGTEYAFDTEAHRDAFLREPETWLTWSDEPEPDGITSMVPS